MNTPPRSAHRMLLGFACFVTTWTVWSFLGARQIDVWAFEIIPSLIGTAGLVYLSYARFRFSLLVYLCVALSFASIAAGARYTYAEMPAFEALRGVFGWTRNHFDRFGHGLQGLTVALLAREVLIRQTNLGKHLGVRVITVSIALAFSAFYELVEWWCVVLFYPHAGPEWLGLQGDAWDAQWDMCMALLGASCVVSMLAPLHDRSIHRVVRR